MDDRFQLLASTVLSTKNANSEQRSEFVDLDQKLRRLPADSVDYLPTKTGNILRAGERRPLEKYGLDAVVLLLLPTSSQSCSGSSRAARS